MMKKVNNMILLFCLLATVINAQLSGYSYYRNLPEVNTAGYYRIPLNAQTLGKSSSGFSDFRVLKMDEADTSEVPYLFEWNEPVNAHSYINEQIINVSYRKGVASYVTIKASTAKEINSIKLLINESDFDKIVTIEGSNDNKHWKIIKENIRIVGFGQQDFVFSTLYFPVSSFDYYLVTINDRNSLPITVKGAQTRHNFQQKVVYEKIRDIYVVRKEVKKNLNPAPGKERVFDNYTEIKVSLPETVCIHSVQLKSRDKSADFYRTLSVTDAKGNVLGNETFTSLGENGITTVYLNNFISKDFTLRVVNKDNPPVEGIDVSVFGMNAFMVSKLEPDEKYVLLYGKKNEKNPDYDLGYFSDKIKQLAKDIEPGTEIVIPKKQPVKKEAFVTEQKWLWIVLGALVLILGLFAFSLMKKVAKPE